MAGNLSIEEFGQRIKAAHPEYADMDDAEVGQKVLAKYPQYGDMVNTMPTGAYPSPAGQPGRDQAASDAMDATQAPPADFLTAAMNSLRGAGAGQQFVTPQGDSKTTQAISGFMLKGLPKTAAGIFSLVPGLQNDPGLKAMKEYATPATPMEGYGQTAEQIAEMLAPAAAAGKAAKAVPVAERVIQGRNAAGQFLKATRSPVVQDLIKRGLVRAGVQAAGTGALNVAHGGDFTSGAVAGAAGGAVPETAQILTPIARQALNNPLTQAIVKHAAVGAGAGTAIAAAEGKLGTSTLSKAALGLLLAHPVGRQILLRMLQNAPAVGMELNRATSGP